MDFVCIKSECREAEQKMLRRRELEREIRRVRRCMLFGGVSSGAASARKVRDTFHHSRSHPRIPRLLEKY